jgi:hypothetical protein
MQTLIIILAFFAWTSLGSYGYIYNCNQHKKKHGQKWRRREVRLVPLFGILGPFSYLAAEVIKKPKTTMQENV